MEEPLAMPTVSELFVQIVIFLLVLLIVRLRRVFSFYLAFCLF
jgi:hypothetical protein